MNTQSICTYTTLKATRQETIDFVNHHLKIGIAHMFLFFDDPRDKAITVLKKSSKITCILCDREYWNTVAKSHQTEMSVPEKQTANSITAIRLAKKRKYDWILHLDVDEFLYSPDRIYTELSALPERIDTISFRPLEAFSDQPYQLGKIGYKYSYTCRFSKKMFVYTSADKIRILASKLSYLIKREFCKALKAGSPFRYRLNKGHIEGKCATRLKSDISSLGPHYPYPSGKSKLRIRVSQQSWVFHYDSASYVQWIHKWNSRVRESGEVIGNSNETPHRFKMLSDYSNYIKNADEKSKKTFYKSLYSISSFEYKIIKYFRGIIEIPRTHTPRFNESLSE